MIVRDRLLDFQSIDGHVYLLNFPYQNHLVSLRLGYHDPVYVSTLRGNLDHGKYLNKKQISHNEAYHFYPHIRGKIHNLFYGIWGVGYCYLGLEKGNNYEKGIVRMMGIDIDKIVSPLKANIFGA